LDQPRTRVLRFSKNKIQGKYTSCWIDPAQSLSQPDVPDLGHSIRKVAQPFPQEIFCVVALQDVYAFYYSAVTFL
jgi:hypothetical protein